MTVGKIKLEKGWIIELTTIHPKLDDVIPNVITYLLNKDIAFQMPNNAELYQKILFGHLGTDIQNKLIIIFPQTNEDAIGIVEDLIELTRNNQYTIIRGSFHLTQGIHVRYDYTKHTVINGADGKKQRYAILSNGRYITSPVKLYYNHPKEIKWIFERIKPYKADKPKTVVGNKTVRTGLLRWDSKGVIYRGLFFKEWYHPTRSIIKSGRKNELMNYANLDASTNIEWQYKMHNNLKELGITAFPLDIVQDDIETSVVLEYIKGQNLSKVIFNLQNIHGWRKLPPARKEKILKITQNILRIISLIHSRNIVHRDIHPSNFIYTKEKDLKILDFGLSYEIKPDKSSPIYTGITVGYSDPFQINDINYIPDFQEDVYSIGAILIYLYTGSNPALFNTDNLIYLTHQLNFLIGNSNITKIICSCLDPIRQNRPTSDKILETLKMQENQILTDLGPAPLIDSKTLIETVQAGVKALFTPIYTTNDLWQYAIADESKERQHDERRISSTGVYTGICGTILSILSMNLPQSDICRTNEAHKILNKNINYIITQYNSSQNSSIGLMMGKYGLGLTIAMCIKNGLTTSNEELTKSTNKLLSCENSSLNFWDGISGKGIFIIKSYNELQISDIENTLSDINKEIIQNQKSNGSWTTRYKHNGYETANIATGDCGILLYLLQYRELSGDVSLDRMIQRGLDKIMHSNLPTNSDNSLLFGSGGIAYVFLEAYRTFNARSYAVFASKLINDINIDTIRENLSFSSGLSGIGFLLLKAAQVLNNKPYEQKAFQIAGYLQNLQIIDENEKIYWYSNVSRIISPDLFHGNAGILTFLSKCISHRTKPHRMFTDDKSIVN